MQEPGSAWPLSSWDCLNSSLIIVCKYKSINYALFVREKTEENKSPKPLSFGYYRFSVWRLWQASYIKKKSEAPCGNFSFSKQNNS